MLSWSTRCNTIIPKLYFSDPEKNRPVEWDLWEQWRVRITLVLWSAEFSLVSRRGTEFESLTNNDMLKAPLYVNMTVRDSLCAKEDSVINSFSERNYASLIYSSLFPSGELNYLYEFLSAISPKYYQKKSKKVIIYKYIMKKL